MRIFEATKSLPADLRAVLEDIKAAIDGRAAADRAAVANRDAIAAGGLRIAELETLSVERDVEAVKAEARASADADLKTEATKAAKAADKANAELADARRTHERRIGAVELLNNETRSIDAAIADLKKRLIAAMTGYRKQVRVALNEDLLEVCPALIPVIQVAMAVDAQIPDGGFARDWLDCAKLISPIDYRSDHLQHHVRVHGTDLLASQDPLPTLPISATTVLQELAAVSGALKRHKPFVPPKPSPPAAAEQPPLTKRELEERARNQAEQEAYDRWDDARAARTQREQTPEERRRWTLDVRYPGTSAPAASQNRARAAASPAVLGARSLDGDGSVLDEYRWLDEAQPGSSHRGDA